MCFLVNDCECWRHFWLFWRQYDDGQMICEDKIGYGAMIYILVEMQALSV